MILLWVWLFNREFKLKKMGETCLRVLLPKGEGFFLEHSCK